jgi:hypothetical protein
MIYARKEMIFVSKGQKQKWNLKNIDPFEISLDTYHNLSNKEYRLVINRLYELYGSWIKEKFQQTKAAALVLCDRKVVYAADNEYEPEDRVINELEKQFKKPCYIIVRSPMIEEIASWSYLGNDDFYPTIEIYLGQSGWSDSKLFSDGVKLSCDFDTGNPRYTVIPDGICGDLEIQLGRRRDKVHLETSYTFYQMNMRVGITDGTKSRSIEKYVEAIADWADRSVNPHLIVNPNREGFVGRDLMLKLLFRINLDPSNHESSWDLI